MAFCKRLFYWIINAKKDWHQACLHTIPLLSSHPYSLLIVYWLDHRHCTDGVSTRATRRLSSSTNPLRIWPQRSSALFHQLSLFHGCPTIFHEEMDAKEQGQLAHDARYPADGLFVFRRTTLLILRPSEPRPNFPRTSAIAKTMESDY